MGFSEKNLEIFPNRDKLQIFSRMRLKWYFFLKMSFHLFLRFFWQKSEKKLKLEKLEIKIEKKNNLKKKHFHPSKRRF